MFVSMAQVAPCLLAMVLAVMISPGSGQTEGRVQCVGGYMRPHREGVCGHLLIQTLDAVCAYLGSNNNKRSMHSNFVKRSSLDPSTPLREVLSDERYALSTLSKRSFDDSESSITCECCYNACTVGDLYRYCPTAKRSIRSDPALQRNQKDVNWRHIYV